MNEAKLISDNKYIIGWNITKKMVHKDIKKSGTLNKEFCLVSQ